MRKTVIRCFGERNGKTCGNILGYISDGKLICARHGRTVEIASDVDGKVSIICECCGKKTVVETKISWKVTKNL